VTARSADAATGGATVVPPAGPGRWAVSPFNTEGLTGAGAFAAPPRISDCTLRDGEQQAGLVFSRQSKVAIATMLDEIGVHDIEVGTPAVSEDDRAAIEEIAASGLRATISALARATDTDIELVAGTGADAVRISFPISSRQRTAKLHIDDAEYVRESLRISDYAKSLGLQVVFSPYDTTRADLPLLERLLQAFQREGCVDRVRLVDTVGAASPEGVRFLVGFMRQALGDIPIEVHCHNDFGLGTANTIAAALAGADYLSVTVNGLGERAGNTPLEEVVVALKVLYGIDTGVATEQLKPVSDEVERLSGIALQPHKAVVGANCFRHETGTVVAGLMRDPFTAEPYAPEVVGQSRQVILGKLSGAASVRYKMTELGIGAADADITTILAAVKERSIALQRSLDDDEVRRIADDVLGSRA
jgi:isopropylmalate/homocitrate/citramalate synthase